METRTYKNDDITVVWEPSKCIHSAICIKGLPRVFNAKKKPWISMEDGTSETIMNQVKQCPSGALSYRNNIEPVDPKTKKETAESLIKVFVSPGGPLLIHGQFTLEKDKVVSNVNNQVTALCRCGNSANKPFCDGSHRNVDFDK